MKVSLNIRREILDVQLEPEDALSPRMIQSSLRRARVPFKTVYWKGRWQVPSQCIEELSAALTQFSASWDQRSEERLLNVRQDNQFRRMAVGQASILDHHLEYKSELGLTPYAEQLEAAQLMSAPGVRRFALFWKPGSGKTGALIAAAHELLSKGIVRGVLVVAERPLAMEAPWVSELSKWLPQDAAGEHVVSVKGSKQQRLSAYLTDPRWAIVHYGVLAHDQYAIRSWAARNQGVERPVIIFDESDLIKNPNARRSRAAMTIRQECGRCWIASGTPAPNAPSDYENQLAILAGYPIGLSLTGDRVQDALVVVHELERGVFYLQRDNPRRMPEMTTPVHVDLSPPQRYEYDRLATDLLSELEDMDDKTYSRKIVQVMSQRMRLLRLCSDPGHDSLPSQVFDTPSKWPRLDSLLETILSDPDEKAVIWTRFRATALALHQRYQKQYGASLMIGGGDGTPQNLDKAECKLLVATMQVGSSSIDLTAARNAIYESIDDVSRNFVQSMARINRTGQTKDCRYWFLIAKDTVEGELFENTIAKMQLSEDVLDEIGRPGRSQMIGMLRRALGIYAEND